MSASVSLLGRRLAPVLAVLATSAFGCSSAAFDTAPSGEDQDTGDTTDSGGTSGDSSGPDTGAGADSNAIDGGSSEGGVDAIEAGVTCSSLPLGAGEVYVDKTSTRESLGTVDCPFHSIAEATALTWPGITLRTIHVSAHDYGESNAIQIGRNIRLLGAGPTMTTLRHGGACPGLSANCVVSVDAGGTLESVSVIGGGAPVVTGLATGTAANPTVVRTTISGATSLAGVYVRGGANLGPNISVTGSIALPGVQSSGGGVIHVFGTGNTFDKNGQAGLSLDGAANLVFDGGSASGNTTNGLRLVGSGSYGVTLLVANGNGSVGVTVGVSGSMRLRKSIITQNRIGVTFLFGGSNVLDLGTPADAGGNVFTTSIGAPRTNTLAAVCLASPPRTTLAQGNSWSVCPVTPMFTDGGCSLDGGTSYPYRDIEYASPSGPAPAGGWADTTGCMVGP